MFISSNKNFAASKQELRNDIVKGKDNYPRTVVGVLKYLQFHSLYVDTLNVTPVLSGNKKHLEIAFVTDRDEMPGEDKRQKKGYAAYGRMVNASIRRNICGVSVPGMITVVIAARSATKKEN